MKIEVRYASNGQKVGDAEFRITRVWENGTRFAVMTNEKTGHMAEVKFVPVEEEEPAPDPTPDPQPDPNPEPTPDPDPTPQPDADYVVGAGGDFASIGAAIAAVPSGSVVMVKAGTYREGTIQITRDHIHVYGEPGAVLDSTARSWNAITVTGDYVTIEGLDIKNAAQDGIEFNNCHHGAVRRCHIHHCGESGIQTNYGDWWTFENNDIHHCATEGWFSGISIYENRNISSDQSAGYRTVIRGNNCHENVTERNQHNDGNGIIIDDFQHTQNAGVNYTFPTLVEANWCWENGGKGVQVVWSDNVTVRNNVCYHNGRDAAYNETWRGDLSVSQSSGARVENNIAIAQNIPGKRSYAILNTSYGGYRNSGATWTGNTAFHDDGTSLVLTDGGNSVPAAGNSLGVRPVFVDEANRDFRIVED